MSNALHTVQNAIKEIEKDRKEKVERLQILEKVVNGHLKREKEPHTEWSKG